MPYQQNIEACFSTHGIAEEEFQQTLGKIEPIVQSLKEQQLPLLTLPEETSDLEEIQATAKHIQDNFQHLVVLGTGGSTLCAQTLTGLNAPAISNSSVEIHYLDNVDPNTFDYYTRILPLDQTCFLVISKSGSTLETLTLCTAWLEQVSEKLGRDKIADHFIFLTIPQENPLRTLGNELGVKILDHASNIGGRFSIYTNVALLPACVAGLNIQKIRTGAANAVKQGLAAGSEAAKGAALQYLTMQRLPNTVMLAYADQLSGFVTWWRQIWAESLGKNGKGSTPIKAMGTIDQHSQLQLYLDGPRDKIFTLIARKTKSNGQKLNGTPSEFDYLNGQTIGDVLAAEYQATKDTLIANNCPTRTFELETIDGETLGNLTMHFVLETIITGELLQENPFDQPAVEEGKLLAKKILSSVVENA